MSAFSEHFAPLGVAELSPANTLKDDTLASRLSGYQRRNLRRFRPLNPHHMREALGSGQLHIAPKLDGEPWFLVKRDGDVALCAPDGRALRGVPVTEQLELTLLGTDNIIVAGELYCAPASPDGRPKVHDLLDVLATGKHLDRLRWSAFDLLQLSGQDQNHEPYAERLTKLRELLDGASDIFGVVPTHVGNAEAAIAAYQEQVGNDLAEGLVIRSDELGTFKVKPFISIDAVVLGFGERRRGDVVQVRELLVGLVRDDGTYHVLARISRGLSDLDRLDWYNRLNTMEVPTAYRVASGEGTLCRFVRPEIVVELQCSALRTHARDGRPVRRMVLDYATTPGANPEAATDDNPLSTPDDPIIIPLITYMSRERASVADDNAPATSDKLDPTHHYAPLGDLPLMRLVGARYVRERPDKKADVSAAGLEQLHRHLPLEGRGSEPSLRDLPPAAILDRKVFVKERSGKTMVRKYVALATRKSALDRRYPPYVVCFSDFSPTRGEPLKTTLKTASNLERLQAHIQDWLDSNIKRGWEPHAAAEAVEAS